MINSIVTHSVRARWFIVFLTAALALYGVWQLFLLPIDALPDITNKQVQINTLAPGLGPVEVEKRVTFPIETALAGLAGVESTRSFSRNGFSQVTAIFKESSDLYFMRQRVAERLSEARPNLPDGAEPQMGPVLDFGLIIDGAVVVVENTLRRIAERQHRQGRVLTPEERSSEVIESSQEMIRPSVYGQLIIFLVFIPCLTFQGVEGKMFSPMVITLTLALASAFVLSITFVPALAAIAITGRVAETEVPFIVRVKRWYEPKLKYTIQHPLPVIAGAGAIFIAAAITFLFVGQEFMPTLDEQNFNLSSVRIPSTSVEQSVKLDLPLERQILSLPEVKLVFSKTGTANLAADPMPPNASDNYVMLKPKSEWPEGVKTKDQIIDRIQRQTAPIVGNAYDVTQPIQMRFNELIGGVPDAIGMIPVMLPAGAGEERRSVPLRQLAAFRLTEGLNEVSRDNGKRRIYVEANVRGRDLASYVADAQAAIDREVKLPAGSWLEWGGQFQNLQAAKQRLTLVVPICVILIFGVLYMALGSAVLAMTVFTAVPLAIAGGVFTLALRGMPFSISAAVGFIAVSGVAVLNGLVLMGSIRRKLETEPDVELAILHGALERVRPVLMTALVASLGFVPMALATRAGAEVQKPLATVVIGGLITSTALTLFVLPAVYRRVLRVAHSKRPTSETLAVPAES
jgi:Cu/Ag efflux pump CusA